MPRVLMKTMKRESKKKRHHINIDQYCFKAMGCLGRRSISLHDSSLYMKCKKRLNFPSYQWQQSRGICAKARMMCSNSSKFIVLIEALQRTES